VTIRIDERYVVRAPPAAVWEFLVDPRCVVSCIPGGELEEVLDERNFHGRIEVVVGPLTLVYRGRVRLAEVDPAALRVKIVGEAREARRAGSSRLVLDSWLLPTADGGTQVVAVVRADVAGRIVRLLRGMIEELARLAFREFAAAVRESLEAEAASRAALAAGAPSPLPRRAAPAPRPPLHPVPLLLRAVRSWAARLVRPGGGDPMPHP
jgi:carbon monoxide dehydrogenase subunit G